jgi:hypothetical protein
MMLRQAREMSPINHSDDASAKKCFALVKRIIKCKSKTLYRPSSPLRNKTEGLKKKVVRKTENVKSSTTLTESGL